MTDDSHEDKKVDKQLDKQNDNQVDNLTDEQLELVLGQGAQMLSQTARTSARKAQGKTAVKCPICNESVDSESAHAPFCSSRCKTIDLGKWVSGDYKISRPVEEADLDEDD